MTETTIADAAFEDHRPAAPRDQLSSRTLKWTNGLTYLCITLFVLGAVGAWSLWGDLRGFQAIGKAATRGGMSGKVAGITMKYKAFFYFLLFAKGAVAISLIGSIFLLTGKFRDAHRTVIMVLGGAILYNVMGMGLAQFVQYSIIKDTPGGVTRVISAQASIRGKKLNKRQRKAVHVLSKKLGKYFHGAIVMVAVGVTMLKCAFYVALILFLTSSPVEEIFGGVPPPW